MQFINALFENHEPVTEALCSITQLVIIALGTLSVAPIIIMLAASG